VGHVVESLLAWLRFWLSPLGDVASLVGFALTVYVSFGIRKIRKFYVLRARLPELNKRLRTHASNLSNHLNDFRAFRDEALKELTTAEVTLRSLKGKLSGPSRRAVKDSLSRLKQLDRSRLIEQQLREVYLQLVGTHEQLKEEERNLKWER
jgi:hypothetical protein